MSFFSQEQEAVKLPSSLREERLEIEQNSRLTLSHLP